MRKRTLLGLVLLSVAIGCLLSGLPNHKAYADSSGAGVPPDLQAQAQNECVQLSIVFGVAFPEAQVSWISAAGDSLNQNPKGIPGQVMNLQWNQATDFCNGAGEDGGSGIIAVNYKASYPSATSGVIIGLDGADDTVWINYSAKWSLAAAPFQFIPSQAGFVGISVSSQAINYFTGAQPVAQGGNFECVGANPGGPFVFSEGYFRHDLNDFGPYFPTSPAQCGYGTDYMFITIPPVGNINGYKVDTNGNPNGAFSPAPVSVTGVGWSGANPFFFNNLEPNYYAVTAAQIPGYTLIGSTWCNWPTACNPGNNSGGANFRAGPTTVVQVTGNSTVQMRWIYEQDGAINGFKINTGNSTNGPYANATIVNDSTGASTATNPFFFNDLTPGTYTISAGTVPGYTVYGSTWCNAVNYCYAGDNSSGQNFRAGSVTTVTVTPGSTVQMRWIYDAIPITSGADTTASCSNGNSNITGWAFDPDDTSASLNISVYMDGPMGSGRDLGAERTTNPSPRVDAAYGITGVHGFIYDLSNYQDYGSHTFYVYAQDILADGSPGPSSNDPLIAARTISDCARFTCAAINTAAASTDISYNVQVTFNTQYYTYPAGTPPNPSRAQGTYSVGGTSVPLTFSYPGGTTMIGTGTFTEHTPGNYPSSASLIYTYPDGQRFTITNGCPTTLSVSNEPYMQVYGGNTLAGGGFSSSPSCGDYDNKAQIIGWTGYDAAENGLLGAGGSLANLALGPIHQFYSGNGGGSGAALALANTTNVSGNGANVGGDFATNAPCASDYYQQAAGNPLPSTDLSDVASSGSYTINGAGPVYLSATAPISKDITVYVNGPVVINTDITYAGWDNVNAIPQVRIISNSNIYISASIQNLYGVYVAQGGTIYDCSNGTTPDSPANVGSGFYTDCSNHLRVYGAFVANQIDFMRTPGTLGDATPAPACTSPDANAAESFCYDPELWLATPPINSIQSPNDIESLPPVL